MDDAQPVLLAGRYRQLETIGAGGMARVFLAEDERLGRRVAVKRLHADSPSDAAARFDREARLGASLNHPNLVSIYDIVTEEEAVLIVMELVEGRTLREEIARGPIGLGTVTSVARDVAAALDHAHAQEIVHRDVKPANILLRDEDGVAKLADLGIATAAASTQITRVGTLLGTPAYMAPEQLEGDRVGRAADVYALAAVLYEALGGEQAVSGSTPVAIAHQVATGPPPDLARVWPDAPAGAADALAWGMARDPRERPRSAGELVTALQSGLDDSPTQRLTSTGSGGRRGAAAGAAGAAAAGGLAGAAAGGLVGAGRGDDRAGRGDHAGAPTAARDPARVLAEREGPGATAARGPRVGTQTGADTAARPPTYGRGRRRVPAWAPVAAVAAIALVIAGSLAFGGGGDGEGDQASQPAADSRDSGGQGEGSESPAPAEEEAPAPAPVEEAPEEEAPVEEEAPAPTGDPVALNDQGFALIKQGRYQEAVPLLQQSVEGFDDGDTSMNHAFALYNLGTALNRSGRPAEAIPFLEQRLAISDFEVPTVERELAAARRGAG
jgi:serine/threonine-protein kinase